MWLHILFLPHRNFGTYGWLQTHFRWRKASNTVTCEICAKWQLVSETHRSTAIKEHPGKENSVLWRLLPGQSAWMCTRTASKHLTPQEDNTRNWNKATKMLSQKELHSPPPGHFGRSATESMNGSRLWKLSREDLTPRWCLFLHGAWNGKLRGTSG